MAAACARPLTAFAPARTAVAPNSVLRDSMSISLFLFTRSRSCRTRPSRQRVAVNIAATANRSVEIGAGQPEITLRFDGGDIHRHPLPRLGQQRKNIDLHGAITQQGLVGDRPTQRQ